MKIVEQSANRLVLKEGALTKQIAGGVAGIVGIGAIAAGFVTGKPLVFGLVGALVLIIGVLLALTAKATVLVADIGARSLEVNFSSLSNRTGSVKHFSFDDMAGVMIAQQMTRSYSANNNQTGNAGSQLQMETTLILQLKDGSTLTLAQEQHGVNNMVGSVTDHMGTVSQLLADTLGVPLQRAGEPTLGQAVQGITQLLSGAASVPVTTPSVAASVASHPTVVPMQPAIPVQQVVQPTAIQPTVQAQPAAVESINDSTPTSQ